MAILNDLIVRGATRCLNTLYANSLQVDSQTISGNLTVNGYTYMGYSTSRSDTKLSVAGITNNQWYRSTGSVGWYNDSYGGGIYMTEPTYVKTYNDKAFYAHNGLYTGASGQYYLNLNGKLNAADGVISNVLNVGNSIIARNVSVTNTLRAAKYDLQTVTQMGTNGTLYVAPSIQFPTSNTVSVVTTSNSITIIDSNIKSTTMAGIVWRANARVKISGTINGIVTGTVDGSVTSININSTTGSGTLVIGNLSGGNWSSVVAGTYTKDKIENLNIMMYETYQNSTYYPVGILLTSYGAVTEITDGTAKTYIDIYGGSTPKPVVRLGNLRGLEPINGVAPDGWGLYTNKGYFSGLIVSEAGKIGGWTLGVDSLSTGTWGTAKSALLSTGTSTTSPKAIGGSSNISGWVFTAGDKFGVTENGDLYASNIHANGGKIGDLSIENGRLVFQSGTRNLLRQVHINYNPEIDPETTGYEYYDLEITESLKANQTYTLQLWDVNLLNNGTTLTAYFCGDNINIKTWLGTSFTNHQASYLITTFTLTQANIDAVSDLDAHFIRIRSASNINISINRWKLEKGNRETDWSIAPEDIQNNLNANNISIAEIDNSLNTYIGNTNDTLNDFNERITDNTSNTNSLRNSIDTYDNWITINTEGESPRMELGTDGSPVHAVLTNEGLEFLLGNEEEAVAYIKADENGIGRLFATSVAVTGQGEMKVGNWVWNQRVNGNMNLKWVDSSQNSNE